MGKQMHRNGWQLIPGFLLCATGAAMADSSAIDKIYHPYVQPQEREIELRTVIENNSNSPAGDQRTLRLGYGQSFTDRWFGEIYLIGSANDDDSFQLSAFEIEALWQLTEQGEFFADWGMLFELEKEKDESIAEASAAVLVEKEWGRWAGTANLYGIYEFGSDVDNEFETALGLQARYRKSRHFEPAIELYKGEDTFGIGPVLLGSHPLGSGRQLRWEAGLIFGIDSDTADQVFRGLLEYEF
jgi:hypothetical protein